MRVLVVMASGARGGGAEHLLGLLPALQARGHDVAAWVGDDGPLIAELSELGVHGRPIRLMHSRFDPIAALELRRAVSQYEPDVVHWHGTRAAFYGAACAGPSVYTAHGLAFRKERSWVRRRIFAASEAIACRADRVISVSRSDRDELVTRGFVEDGHAFYVPNAVREARFRERPDRATARQRLGLDPERFVVGTTSRLVEQKGVDVALRAIADVDGATFVVMGEGPLEGELRNLGRSLGVDVHWLGRRDDVDVLLSAVDVFLLASRWEGEPIALLEAMHCEVPCVATETEGAIELLGGGAGWLAPVDDPRALSAAIEDARHARAPEPALDRVRERSFARMADRVEQVLGDACRHPKGRG